MKAEEKQVKLRVDWEIIFSIADLLDRRQFLSVTIETISDLYQLKIPRGIASDDQAICISISPGTIKVFIGKNRNAWSFEVQEKEECLSIHRTVFGTFEVRKRVIEKW
ncbi:MAG: hypothetical protein AAGI23_21840 [Bacteroidota bacterium]